MSKLVTDFLKWFSGLKPWVKYVLMPYILLVVLHSFFVFSAHGPAITPDEPIYLSHARFFTGLPPFYFLQYPYSSFLYGLFLTPLFLITENQGIVYKLIVFFNGVYLSTSYIFLFLICKKIFRQDYKSSFLYSALAVFLPGIFVRSYYALMENAFIPLFYLVILSFYYFLKKPNWKNSLVFSLAAVLIFAAHYRGIVILVLLFFCVSYLFFSRGKKRYAIFSILIMATGYFLVNKVNNYLINIAWVEPLGYLSSEKMFRLLDLKRLRLIPSVMAGQLLYLTISSFGLFIFGLKYLGETSRRDSLFNQQDRANKYFVYFLCILILLMFGLSSTFLIISHDYNLVRPDHFVYGRYNEVFLPLFIVFGLIGIKENKKISTLNILLINLFLFLILFFGASDYLKQYNFASINAISFIPMAFIQPIRGLVLILFFSSLFIYFIYRLKKFKSMVIIIFLLFFLNILCAYFLERRPDNLNTQIFEQTIVKTVKETKAELLYYDLSAFHKIERKNAGLVPWFWERYYFILQYFLPHTRVYPFDSYKNEKAAGEAVVAACEWQDSNYKFISGIIIDPTNPETESNCMGVFKKVTN